MAKKNTNNKLNKLIDNCRHSYAFISIGFLVLGIIINALTSWHIRSSEFGSVLGMILILVGLVLILMSLYEFHQNESSININDNKFKLPSKGVYKFSRNPIYLGAIVFSCGFAFSLDNVWILLSQVVSWFIYEKIIIPKEESLLQKKFGAVYKEYSSRVRRWV